jgi:hypothetical protein
MSVVVIDEYEDKALHGSLKCGTNEESAEDPSINSIDQILRSRRVRRFVLHEKDFKGSKLVAMLSHRNNHPSLPEPLVLIAGDRRTTHIETEIHAFAIRIDNASDRIKVFTFKFSSPLSAYGSRKYNRVSKTDCNLGRKNARRTAPGPTR